jgi:hypothetical protein
MDSVDKIAQLTKKLNERQEGKRKDKVNSLTCGGHCSYLNGCLSCLHTV